MLGTEWVSTIATIVGIPWWGLITIKGPLWLFIVFYAILSKHSTALRRVDTYDMDWQTSSSLRLYRP